jgi:hypothetical protein
MSKPKVKITKGGNQGGRRTEGKFGENPNSIEAQLPFMSTAMRQRVRENQRRLADDASSMEQWAANDFHSGYEVKDNG